MTFASSDSGSSYRTSEQREIYLHALEQDREEVLTEAYANKTPTSSRSHTNTRSTSRIPDFGRRAEIDASQHAMYDERGRQRDFRETVSQRQERLEFIRRQECARRLARKGRQDPSVSEYAIKRLAVIHSRPVDRVQAAVKIQRAYRAHRALGALTLLERRIAAAADPSHDARAALSYLRARAADLGSLGAFLDAAPHMTDDSRVLRSARRVTEVLRRALDRAEFLEREREGRDVWVHTTRVAHIERGSGCSLDTIPEDDSSGSDPDDDFDYSCNSEHYSKRCDVVRIPRLNTYEDWQWMDSSDSDSSEEDFELGLVMPEGANAGVSEARRAAFRALCSGSDQQKRWIAQILTAPPLHRTRRYSGVSKVPALLTISEDAECET